MSNARGGARRKTGGGADMSPASCKEGQSRVTVDELVFREAYCHEKSGEFSEIKQTDRKRDTRP